MNLKNTIPDKKSKFLKSVHFQDIIRQMDSTQAEFELHPAVEIGGTAAASSAPLPGFAAQTAARGAIWSNTAYRTERRA